MRRAITTSSGPPTTRGTRPVDPAGRRAARRRRGVMWRRGHARTGALPPAGFAVVGPRARHAGDVDLAMRALVGRDVPQQASWRVELAPPRQRRLGDFRVAVWTQSPLCEIDRSVGERFAAAIAALSGPGASLDTHERPPNDDEEHDRPFLRPLRPATAPRLRLGALAA